MRVMHLNPVNQKNSQQHSFLMNIVGCCIYTNKLVMNVQNFDELKITF